MKGPASCDVDQVIVARHIDRPEPGNWVSPSTSVVALRGIGDPVRTVSAIPLILSPHLFASV